MQFQDNLQPNRFEFKYIVSEMCAAAVRDFVLGYLEPDPYARQCQTVACGPKFPD